MSFLDDLKESVSSLSLDEVIELQKNIQSRRTKIAERRTTRETKKKQKTANLNNMTLSELQEAMNKLKEMSDDAN